MEQKTPTVKVSASNILQYKRKFYTMLIPFSTYNTQLSKSLKLH